MSKKKEPVQQAPVAYVISAQVRDSLLAYLEKRPYFEVAGGIEWLRKAQGIGQSQPQVEKPKNRREPQEAKA